MASTVAASPESVLAFYRRELGALGWKETEPLRNQGGRMVAAFASADGPGLLTIERKGRETRATLLLRKEAEARKAGMLRKPVRRANPGQHGRFRSDGRHRRRTFRLAAGVGSKAPDGPWLDVAPGSHRATIRAPGKPDVVENVTVRAGEIWGVVIGPGGALPLPMY